jgi:hypothetical protein
MPYCRNGSCDNFTVTVAIGNGMCAICKSTLSMVPSAKTVPGVRPAPKLAPKPAAKLAAAADRSEISQGPYKPKKLTEMSAEQWEAYTKSVGTNHAKHIGRPLADLSGVPYLYHETTVEVLEKIRKEGLSPRDPAWKTYKKKERVPRWDASKDGYLSMSRTLSGAAAMGGPAVMLRFPVGGDIADWAFRQVGETEVRTQAVIPAARLESSLDHRAWTALVAVPAAVVPAAADAPVEKDDPPK